jgi:glycosyltransferase involved in cell wall biosynthesis
MRVAFCCGEYPPHRGGGIGTFTRALGRELVRRGIGVDVVGIYGIERDTMEYDEGVRVWRLAGAQLPYTRFVRNGRKLTGKLRGLRVGEGLDLVEGQENAFAAVGRLPGVKKVIRMHGGHHFFAVTLGKRPAFWRGWQEKRSFEQADAICAVSRFVAETTRELLRLGRREIEILPNFVDTELFRPREAAGEEEGLIVSVGTVCEKKGVRQLIDAMPAILAACPDARLVVAGRDLQDPAVGGSFQAFLLSRMRDEVKRRVEFVGPVAHERLPELLARASVCVYPSLMEAMPMAWLEAMAMAKAVVASRLGPGPEVIEDGVDGLLCDPRNTEELAEKVITALGDGELRRRLGRAARERVMREFSPAVMIEKNLQFYQRVVDGFRS